MGAGASQDRARHRARRLRLELLRAPVRRHRVLPGDRRGPHVVPPHHARGLEPRVHGRQGAPGGRPAAHLSRSGDDDRQRRNVGWPQRGARRREACRPPPPQASARRRRSRPPCATASARYPASSSPWATTARSGSTCWAPRRKCSSSSPTTLLEKMSQDQGHHGPGVEPQGAEPRDHHEGEQRACERPRPHGLADRHRGAALRRRRRDQPLARRPTARTTTSTCSCRSRAAASPRTWASSTS